MEEEGDSESLLQKYKVYIITGFIVFFIVSFIIGFFMGKQPEDINEEDRIIFSAIEENNFSVCDSLNDKEGIYSCRILVGVNLGNESFCDNEFENLSVFFGSLVTPKVKIKARDYCWILMAVHNKINYCENASLEARQICLNNMEYWRI